MPPEIIGNKGIKIHIFGWIFNVATEKKDKKVLFGVMLGTRLLSYFLSLFIYVISCEW